MSNSGCNRLAMSLPLKPMETSDSLAVRLARLHQVASPREFLNDMGIPWRPFRYGERDILVQFAKTARVAPADLCRFSAIRIDRRFREINGQRLRRPTLQHGAFRYCPRCVLDALEAEGLHGPYQSAEWLISPIRACAIHHIELQEIASTKKDAIFDLGFWGAYHQPELRRMVNSARDRPLTDLERYLSDRLKGSQTGVWADNLSFFVVALTSFHLGVLLSHGPRARVNMLTPGEISAAEQVGFRALKAGPDALAEALESVRSDRKIEYLGFARDHKQFFDWLNKSYLGSDFEPIREVVRSYIFQTFPIPKGETVFGVACPRRYVHTLSTAALQHRVCKKKLAGRLIEVGAGRADVGTNKLTLPHCLDADLADAAAKDLKSMLDAKAAQKFIGATEPEFRHLRRAGIIVPDTRVGTAAKRYATAMLNQAIARLNERTVPVARVPAHCKRISRASLNAKMLDESDIP